MFRLWFSLVALGASLVSSHAQEVPVVVSAAPLFPAPQKAFSTTLRATGARWERRDADFMGLKEKTPVFTSTWEFSSPWPEGQNEMGFMRYPQDLVRLVSVHGPDGTPLETAMPDSRSGSTGKPTQLFVRNADVNPTWPFLSVEWEILDPTATLEMSGRKSSLARWKGLNFPVRAGEKTTVRRTFTTPDGSDITLVSIGREAARGSTAEQLVFEVKLEPGESAPDAKIEVSFDHASNDEKIYRSQSQGTGFNGTFIVVRSGLVPPSGAILTALSLRVGESSISLQNRSHYKRLRFQIPLAPLENAPPVPAIPITPVIPVETAHVRGQLESVRVDPNQNWRALLWIQAPETAREPGLEPQSRYFLRRGGLLKSKGNESRVSHWTSDDNTRFVHLDGTASLPGERSHLLSAWADVPPPYDLSLEFERGRRRSHFATLKNIEIPLLNSLELAKSDADSFFAVRRVFRYQDPREVVGLAEGGRNALPLLSGIAVVIEMSPTLPDAALDLRPVRVWDQDGRQWSDPALFRNFAGDMTQPFKSVTEPKVAARSRFCTIFLPGLGASSTHFSLELKGSETQWEGQNEIAKIRIEP